MSDTPNPHQDLTALVEALSGLAFLIGRRDPGMQGRQSRHAAVVCLLADGYGIRLAGLERARAYLLAEAEHEATTATIN